MQLKINKTIQIKIDKMFNGKSVFELFNTFYIGRKDRYLYLQDGLTVNGQKVTLDTILHEGDYVIVDEKLKHTDGYNTNEIADVVYEDDLLLIVNKPENLIIHSEEKNQDTLDSRVGLYFSMHNKVYPVRHLHRLDEDTKGLVMYCKHPFFQPYFDRMISEKEIKRYYFAIVIGQLTKTKIIDKSIGRNRHQKGYIVYENGKYSKTKITPICFQNGYTLVECELFTGRTHQIRVHLNSENLYLVNDSLYGKKSHDFSGMGLYAYKIEWIDPITQKKMTVKLPSISDLDYFKMFKGF